MGGAGTGAGVGGARGVAEAMEIRDSENYRLCCPECGYDLLKVDIVNVLTEEQVRCVKSKERGGYIIGVARDTDGSM